MNELYPPDVNPVRALYDLWHSLLQARSPIDIDVARNNDSYIVTPRDMLTRWNNLSLGYGARGYRICVVGNDVYGRAVLGYMKGPYGHPDLVLCPDNRFSFGPGITRSKEASAAFADHTFLDRIHTRRWGMRWLIHTHHWSIHRNYVNNPLGVHVYSGESLVRSWRPRVASIDANLAVGITWWVAEEAPHTLTGWEIVPAPDQSLPARPSGRPSRTVFDEYESDRQRMTARLKRLENQHRVASGLPKLSEHPGRLRDGRQLLEGQEAASRLAGHLPVIIPITTTPLRRKAHPEARKEAHQDG